MVEVAKLLALCQELKHPGSFAAVLGLQRLQSAAMAFDYDWPLVQQNAMDVWAQSKCPFHGSAACFDDA